jgi:hypothetical protein
MIELAQEVISISPQTSRICRVGAFILERTGLGTETVSRTRLPADVGGQAVAAARRGSLVAWRG